MTEIEVTGITVSKKGTVWIQAKALNGSEEMKVGDKFTCEKIEEESNEQNKTEN